MLIIKIVQKAILMQLYLRTPPGTFTLFKDIKYLRTQSFCYCIILSIFVFATRKLFFRLEDVKLENQMLWSKMKHQLKWCASQSSLKLVKQSANSLGRRILLCYVGRCQMCFKGPSPMPNPITFWMVSSMHFLHLSERLNNSEAHVKKILRAKE